jgi:hypothetical protein
MFCKNEIRAVPEASIPKADVKAEESKMAMQLIESLAAPFEPNQYSDAYQQQLEKLIEAKTHGKKLAVMPRSKREPVMDSKTKMPPVRPQRCSFGCRLQPKARDCRAPDGKAPWRSNSDEPQIQPDSGPDGLLLSGFC